MGCKPSRGGAPSTVEIATLPSGAIQVAPDSPLSARSTSSTPKSLQAPLGMPLGAESTKNAPLSFAPIVRAADPSVVTISTVGEELEPLSPFSRRVRRREAKGLGTGVLVDRDGTILTNNHVIEGADTITVKLADDRELPAKIVGRDPRTDIAVVKIDGKDLAALPLGDSDRIDVGDWVVAIGNPFGLSHTVSAGIVSAKGRTKDDVPLDDTGYYDFIQTDASINPGNSGGPLLNLKGEVVGINSAIRGDGAQGIGFAIPINMIKQLLPMLLRDGHVTRSALGIQMGDLRKLSLEDRALLKLTDDKGTLIAYVSPGGAADKAGLTPGDVILTFDGQSVDRGTHLQWLASTAGVGRTVTLRVSREGKVFDIKVTLGQLPDAAVPSSRRQGGREPLPGGRGRSAP
jgi:serine protease Do